jgi:hypothetical protein
MVAFIIDAGGEVVLLASGIWEGGISRSPLGDAKMDESAGGLPQLLGKNHKKPGSVLKNITVAVNTSSTVNTVNNSRNARSILSILICYLGLILRADNLDAVSFTRLHLEGPCADGAQEQQYRPNISHDLPLCHSFFNNRHDLADRCQADEWSTERTTTD